MTTNQPLQDAGPWKCGNEFLPYHPKASHVNPDHRDGWNACYKAMQVQPPAGMRLVPVESIKHWCETCEGLGYYDATLGSDSRLANPKQECQDCDGNGYWIATAPSTPAPALPVSPEPVAWRTRYRSDPAMIGHYPWGYTDWLPKNNPMFYECEPLYTSPKPAPDATKPTPASHDHIADGGKMVYEVRQPLTDDAASLVWPIAQKKWNAQADGYNQWDSLGHDEMSLLIVRETELHLGITANGGEA